MRGRYWGWAPLRELAGEAGEDRGGRFLGGVSIAGAGPEVHPLRITSGGRRSTHGTCQVVQRRIPVRRKGFVPVDELVAQSTGGSAREGVGQYGRAVFGECGAVGGRCPRLLAAQQQRADGHRVGACPYGGGDTLGGGDAPAAMRGSGTAWEMASTSEGSGVSTNGRWGSRVAECPPANTG